MKAKLTLENGKTIDMELTKEQEELINQSEKKRTGYERVDKGEIYYSSDNGFSEIAFLKDEYGDIDNTLYDSADYINDKTLAKNIARADTLMRKLKRFAVENGGSFSREEWANEYTQKYGIYFNYIGNKLDVTWIINHKEFGQIYFHSIEIAQKAIDTFKEDLMWCFTEFDDMLR